MAMAARKINIPLPPGGDLTGYTQLPWQGNARARVMVVVDPIVYTTGTAPEVVRPLNKRMLEQLAPFMRMANLKGEDLCFVAACGPVHEDIWKSESKLNKKLKEDNSKWREAFAKLKPRLILSQGKAAIRQVLNRPAKITKMRGVAFHDEHLKTIVMPTLGVAHVSRVPEHGELFQADLLTAARIIRRGFKLEEDKHPKNYKWTTDLAHVLAQKPKIVSLDTEASSFGAGFPQWYIKASKILTVQLTIKAGESYVVPIDYPGYPIDKATRTKLIAQLKQLLEDPKVRVIGQNLKFDVIILLKKLGIRIANYSDDILMLAHMLNENMLSKALDDIARVYLPEMAGYKDEFRRKGYDMGRMDLVPPDDILAYSGADSDAVFQLFTILLNKIAKDPALYNCYTRVVMPGMRAFVDIEQEGFKVNCNSLELLRRKVTASQVKLKIKLMGMIPETIKDAFRNTGVGLKLTRDALLRAFLFTHPDGLKLKPLTFTKGTKQPSVSSKTHLPYFVTEHPFIADIMKYIKNDQLLTTFIGRDRHISLDGKAEEPTGFWQYIHNSFVRPTYRLHGTVTGRSSSRDPNGQNFPKRGDFAKEYRAIFEAPPGWVLIEADYSQLELRIAGITAREPLFLKTYREGGDIHCLTASIVMGMTLDAFMRLRDTDPETFDLNRFRAKAVNFGFIYGMGWKKFRAYAKTEYNIDYTEDEAKEIRAKFFGRYRYLTAWHEAVRDFVRDHGYVRCFDGRVRHLPAVVVDDDGVRSSAERQAINSPVQGFGSDLGVMALARINSGMDRNICRVVGFVHDAVIAIAKIGHELVAAREIKRYMESNPLQEWFKFKSPIPIIADIKIGYNLAKMIELKKSWLDDKNVTTFEQVKELAAANDNKSKPSRRVIRFPKKAA